MSLNRLDKIGNLRIVGKVQCLGDLDEISLAFGMQRA